MNHISHSIDRTLDDMLESAQLTDIDLSEELEPIQMASETLGRDLLQGCLQEVRNLPEVWPKLSEHRQADVIERLTARISSSVKMAVRILAADNRPTIDGILESVAVKDGIKATFKVSHPKQSCCPGNAHRRARGTGRACPTPAEQAGPRPS